MTAANWCAFVAVVAALSWLAGFHLCWRWYVAPCSATAPTPSNAPVGDESTQYLDVDVVTRRLEPIGIATIAIRHNQPEARN